MLSNYKTARKYGGRVQILTADLWGADGTQNNTAPYPGDNGDWTFYDKFINALIADINKNNMQTGLDFDVWNEPDGGVYWQRSQDQFNQMYVRGTKAFRAAFGSKVLVVGPSTASTPTTANSWWSSWAQYVQANNGVPDQYTWHLESGGGSVDDSHNGLQQLINAYGLPQKTININEYAIFNEQNPSGSSWFIAQLERANAIGLRGNWLSGFQLHDFFASLLSKPGAPDSYSATGTGYFPNGDFQIYKYYAQNMTGHRVGTSASGDQQLDTYATVDTTQRTVRVMAGLRESGGYYYITIDGLSSLGLPTSGSLPIHTYQFANSGHWGEIDSLNDLGSYTHSYSGNSVTFWIQVNPTDTANVFQFQF